MIAELQKVFGTSVTSAQLTQYNKTYLERAWAGELRRIKRGVWDLTQTASDDNSAIATRGARSTSVPVTAKPKKIDAKMIKKRFEVMGTLADGVIANNIRALMIAGSAGVGKTFELEQKLEAAVRNKEIESYEAIKGSISAIGLYQALWNNKDKGQVLLLDDSDAVFSDEEALNLLKAALDTSTKRRISWAKASRFLKDEDIPNSFDYEGQIVFITNTNPDQVVARGGKFAPHMSALLSRSVFLDLCIHDAQAIMVRIEQVLEESDLQHKLKLKDTEVKMIVKWMNENVAKLRSISIRTVIQLAGFIKTSDSWEDLAQMTLLKSEFNR